MREFSILGTTLPDAYHSALYHLEKYGDIANCADWNCKQKEISVTMRVLHPLQEPRISLCSFITPEDLQQYIFEIRDGLLDFCVDSGKLPYTYHKRMIEPVDQLFHAMDTLHRNPSSRRAVIDIRRPEDIFSDDPPCLQHVQLFIREGKLHMYVLFRSNDAVKATFTNAYGLIELQRMCADALKVPIGSYIHRVNSFHCYERDFNLLKAYVDRICVGDNVKTRYDDSWKEMMDESTCEIMEKVRRLKYERS